jgi:hypothetical protein
MVERGRKKLFQASPKMIRNRDLDVPRLPVKKDRRVEHDWRQPATRVAERAIDGLEWQLERARDELATDLHRTAKQLGCLDHFTDAPGDPLSRIFSAYDVKIEQATRAFRRALGVPVPPLDD